MTQIFGDYIEPDDAVEHLVIRFSPVAMPLQQRWRNNGLSADFLAEYWTTFFSASDTLSEATKRAKKGAIAYVANELLENVMKFNYNLARCSVNLGLYLYEDEIRFYTSNVMNPNDLEAFQARIRELLAKNPADSYIEQVERSALLASEQAESGLGLLTMVHDYEARLAWKFEEVVCENKSTKLVSVNTLVRLDFY